MSKCSSIDSFLHQIQRRATFFAPSKSWAANDFIEFDNYSNFSLLKAKWRSNPTILERNESSDSVSLHDVDISVDIPTTSENDKRLGTTFAMT